jgi:Zn-finger nucleic acid-binding protein
MGLLEAQLEELKKANEDLSQERAALRERAGVIEKRYTELMERTARSVPSPAQASDEELQSLRQRLDAERREREEASKTKQFWMVCPKCGGKLEEVEHEGVRVERCHACAGVYLDKGELEAIVSAKGESGFLQSLRGLFS